jgi:hypothetical protein
MRRRSRSSDEIEKLAKELDLSEEILSKNVVGGTDSTVSRARRSILDRSSLLDSLKTTCANFGKWPVKTNLHSSIKFPMEAFSIDESSELDNPDLFTEVYPMTYISASIFAMAEVRHAAREGKIDTNELDIISTPVNTASIVKAFQMNESYFRSKLKTADYKFLSSVASRTNFDADDSACEEDSVSDFVPSEEDGEQDRKKVVALLKTLWIEYFGDDNAQSSCLYMIARNPSAGRITLIFRGSTTLQDWMKNSKLIVSNIENPVSDRPNQLPMIGVHKGFREYLYGDLRTIEARESAPEPSVGNDELFLKDCDLRESAIVKLKEQESTTDILNYLGLDESLTMKEKQESLWSGTAPRKNPHENFTPPKNPAKSESRLARILDELMILQTEYDDYNIYVSGHSLGGALGLMSALEIAARFGKEDRPVTFVGIGNPRAGTEVSFRQLCKRKIDFPILLTMAFASLQYKGFRDAVEVLEREGKMRCINIHGRFDLVPMLPNAAFTALAMAPRSSFCQAGFELVLDSESNKFYMRRSENYDHKYMRRLGFSVFRADRIHERHDYNTYLKDLTNFERPLKKLYLNDFYNKLVEEDLFPCSEKQMAPFKVIAERGRKSFHIVKSRSSREIIRVASADDLRTNINMIEDL